MIVLFEGYGDHSLSYAKSLLQCPFIAKYFPRILTINHNDIAWPLLRGCYTSLGKHAIDLISFRSICYPSVYNWETENIRSEDTRCEKRLMASFRGNLESHIIRRRLAKIYRDSSSIRVTNASAGWYAHSDIQRKDFVTEALDSHFILCPRGHSPSTYRLYEAMALGRCPVIISDDWAPPQNIDWPSCSLRVAENEIAHLPKFLEGKLQYSDQLGAAARREWEKSFRCTTKFSYFAQQLTSLAEQTLPKCYRSTEDCQAYWQTYAFRHKVGATAIQKLTKRLRNFMQRRISAMAGNKSS
jgi:hypothetical protein